MTDHAALTDDELAAIMQQGSNWFVIVPRLIADLRAARGEAEELRRQRDAANRQVLTLTEHLRP